MDNWTPKDIQDFFWSLGPAAVGLFLIWFGQTKVAPYRAVDDPRMKLATVGAYAGCWVIGIAALSAFVWIWIGPYLSHSRYLRGSLVDVPNTMSVSTFDADTAAVFFISERTKDRAPLRTFAFVIRDAEGTAGRSTLSLSFSSRDDEFVTNVELQKIGAAALLDDIRLAFKETKAANGEPEYSLAHGANSFALTRPTRHSTARQSGRGDGPTGTRFAGVGLLGLLAAYAQSAPSTTWTRSTVVAGLESPALKVRDVAIQELADKLFSSADYAAIAEAVVSRREESATLRGRWSVYEALRVAIGNSRDAAATRNGILDPPVPVALPLSEATLARVFVDALSGTASANDAAKWLFRHSGDRRLFELLFRRVEAEQDPATKACYAAFTANVFYNWAVDVFLAAKADKPWFVSDGDLKLIEGLYGRVAALSTIAAADEGSASQFLIAGYGLGLFYAELSLLPAERLKGPVVQSPAERERWAARSKALMGQFAARLAPGSKLLQDYRFPFQRDIASAVASSGVSTAALDPATPRIVNPNIRDIVCKVSAPL